MTNFSNDAGILFVDVGLCGDDGSLCIAPSTNTQKRLTEFLKKPLPINIRGAILSAGEKGLVGTTSNMDFNIDTPTFIVFTTLHKNWTFNRQCPIEISGGLNNSEVHAKLIQISDCDDCFILYKDCEYAHAQKYSIFVDVKNGNGPNASITKLIIDPGGNSTPGTRP